MDRTKFIGGSDIAAVMGMSRWKTPLQLWAEKTGKVEQPDLSNVEAVEMGSELEETMARMFTKRTGKKVRRAPKDYKLPPQFDGQNVYDCFSCQVDRLVEGTDELLECKTASAWKEKEWEDEEIPAEYILQVQWQLGITGRSVGHIAVLIGGQKFVYKEIKADPELFAKMLKEAIKFWSMVEMKTPPMAAGDDNDFIIKLHPENDEQLQEMQEMNDSIALLQQLKEDIKNILEQKDEVEAKLKQVIGDNLGIETSDYKLTWKKQTTTRLDQKNLKEEQPEIYNRYAYTSDSRVLRVRKA